MNRSLKIIYIVITICLLNTQTIFGALNSLSGYRAESIVTDPREFAENVVVYSDNSMESIEYTHTMLFIDGQLVSADIKVLNGCSYLYSGNVEKLFDCDISIVDKQVQVTKKDKSFVLNSYLKLEDGTVFIPLRELFEKMNYYVSYKGINDKDLTSIIMTRPCIYVDTFDSLNKNVNRDSDYILSIIRNRCLDGLDNYTQSMEARIKNESFGIEQFDEEFVFIENCIMDMKYIGQTSRYLIYDMNVYRVLYDITTGEIYFNYNTGLATYTKIVDVNDELLFDPLFIIG